MTASDPAAGPQDPDLAGDPASSNPASPNPASPGPASHSAAPAAIAAADPLPRTAFSTLRRRREFLACANRGRHCATEGLMLQARRRPEDEPAETPVRIGYTCSKKVGNAVARNRAKRRLRAAAAAAMPEGARAGWDYVLVGRAEATAARPFAALTADLAAGMARLHAREDEGRPERPRPPSGKRGRGGKGKPGGKPAGGGRPGGSADGTAGGTAGDAPRGGAGR
ncbi:MAG: ribonuclease P protein component [Pseudomonadota bacterium]|nr:ribonuclease P protein component [Pseudomonadota bacterium]